MADQKKLRPYSSGPQANCHSSTISVTKKMRHFLAGGEYYFYIKSHPFGGLNVIFCGAKHHIDVYHFLRVWRQFIELIHSEDEMYHILLVF